MIPAVSDTNTTNLIPFPPPIGQTSARQSKKPKAKAAKTKRSLTMRQMASIRLKQLYSLADFRRAYNVDIDDDDWIYVLAATLACGTPGPIRVGRLQRTYTQWLGLTEETLQQACERCCIDVNHHVIAKAVRDNELWVDRNGGTVAYFRPKTLGDLLGLTAEERDEAKVWSADAVDEPRAERQERRRREAADRLRKKRRANGTKPRAQYEADSATRRRPWELVGMGRSAWYAAGQPQPAGIVDNLAA